MGSKATKFDNINTKENNNSAFNPSDPPPSLSEVETKLLKEVWVVIKHDLHKVGVITFVK